MTSKIWLRRFGAGLVILSFYLLWEDLDEHGLDAVRLASEPGLLTLGLAASLVYAALLVLPAAAWSCVLRGRDGGPIVSVVAVVIYAKCNILKYLPGNVFHFGGRQLMAHGAGWSHRSIFVATTLEVVSLPWASGCVALIALLLSTAAGIGDLPDVLGSFDVTPVAVALGLALAGLAMAAAVAVAHRLDVSFAALAAMATLQIAFFAASAALVAGMAVSMGAVEPSDLTLIAAAYLASWIAGFVVPGAPGGIGVREAVFLHFAAVAVSAPLALALTLLARLVTSLGDLWFALAAAAVTIPETPFSNEG